MLDYDQSIDHSDDEVAKEHWIARKTDLVDIYKLLSIHRPNRLEDEDVVDSADRQGVKLDSYDSVINQAEQICRNYFDNIYQATVTVISLSEKDALIVVANSRLDKNNFEVFYQFKGKTIALDDYDCEIVMRFIESERYTNVAP